MVESLKFVGANLMDCLEFTEPWGCHFVYSLTPTKENVTLKP